MKVEYYPDSDSLYMKLREGEEAYGKEVERGVVFHYDDAGAVVSIEMDSFASGLVDVGTLEASGIDRVVSSREGSPEETTQSGSQSG